MSVILATAGYDHKIRFWEAPSGICSRYLKYPDSQGSVNVVWWIGVICFYASGTLTDTLIISYINSITCSEQIGDYTRQGKGHGKSSIQSSSTRNEFSSLHNSKHSYFDESNSWQQVETHTFDCTKSPTQNIKIQCWLLKVTHPVSRPLASNGTVDTSIVVVRIKRSNCGIWETPHTRGVLTRRLR
jgi:hypothetical protein